MFDKWLREVVRPSLIGNFIGSVVFAAVMHPDSKMVCGGAVIGMVLSLAIITPVWLSSSPTVTKP